MTHTTLFKNEIYLTVTSIISVGVLNGYEYFNLVLAVLLITPVIRLPVEKLLNKQKQPLTNLNKCTSCK